MMIDEAIRWKKIEEFPNYSISELGEVKNDVSGKYLKLRHDKSGYLVCGLCNHCRRKEKKIHRLIAMAFIPNPDNKPYINHINGIKDDNRIENLEWCTAKENSFHAWNVLDSENRRMAMAEHSHKRKWSEESKNKMKAIAKQRVYTEEYRKHMSESHKGREGNHKTPVRCVETGIIYLSVREAANDIGIGATAIFNALRGISKTAKGYHWERIV